MGGQRWRGRWRGRLLRGQGRGWRGRGRRAWCAHRKTRRLHASATLEPLTSQPRLGTPSPIAKLAGGARERALRACQPSAGYLSYRSTRMLGLPESNDSMLTTGSGQVGLLSPKVQSAKETDLAADGVAGACWNISLVVCAALLQQRWAAPAATASYGEGAGARQQPMPLWWRIEL